ncbi:MAG: hypothetical protein WCK67_05330 [bacterium]
MNTNSRLYLKSVKKFLIDENILFVAFKLTMRILGCYQDINKKSKLVNEHLMNHQNKLETTKLIIKTHASNNNESLNIFQ